MQDVCVNFKLKCVVRSTRLVFSLSSKISFGFEFVYSAISLFRLSNDEVPGQR